MRVLITGFGPFPNAPVNPTGGLAEALAQRLSAAHPSWRVESALIPTEWGAPRAFLENLATSPPLDAIFSLGVGTRGPFLQVERFAVNQQAAKRPDQRGRMALEPTLNPSLPDQLEGVLHTPPYNRVTEAAINAGLPVRYSSDAGTYLCNAQFFGLLALGHKSISLASPSLSVSGPVGFIHVPHISGQTTDRTDPRALPRVRLLDALFALVDGWVEAAPVGPV